MIALVLLLATAVSSSSFSDSNAWGFYELSDVKDNDQGMSGTLTFKAGNETCPYGQAISPLNLNVYFLKDATVRIKITDPSTQRWEVPDILQPLTADSASALYDISYTESPFTLAVSRTNSSLSDPVVFNSSSSLFFSNKFIQIANPYPRNTNIFGLGERVGPFRYDLSSTQTYSFMASDHFTPPKLPLYGSHPFYMEVRKEENVPSSESHGFFLLNSNPMDAELSPDGIVFRTIGGVLDMFLMLGPTPQDVTKQYHALIGRPYFPPIWALGYHQCRWGYHNFTELQTVIDKFDEHALPADVFWVDIDYMDKWKMFTFDPAHFPQPEMKSIVDALHASGRRFVPIIDPGVYIEPGYAAYDKGVEMEVFVRDPQGVNFTIGKVWPGLVHYPDWTHPNTSVYWTQFVTQFHQDLGMDGLWTDMNEVASFCDGRCVLTAADDSGGASSEDQFVCNCSARFDTGSWDDPVYQPVDTRDRTCRAVTGPPIHGLDCGTISMASHYHMGREHDMHNLYGHMEAKQTAAVLQSLTNKRPFVLSRSTFPSSGHYNAHWLGDNDATWYDLWKSVPGVLNMNLFGVPLVGSDICGFGGETTAELCARWMQAGSFFPFMRNHNTIGAESQEPYALGEQVLAISRAVLRRRYSLLPYWYSCFQLVHSEGGSVAVPLLYNFPNDPNTYSINNQTMVGRDLLVSPVLTQGAVTVDAYFPDEAVWYDLESGNVTMPAASSSSSSSSSSTSRWVTLPAPLEKLHVHLRGGSVLPMQEPANNTQQQAGNDYRLIVSLPSPAPSPSSGLVVATGRLYSDDGESLPENIGNKYTLIQFRVVTTTNGSAVDAQGFDVFAEAEQGTLGPKVNVASVSVLGWLCPEHCISGLTRNSSSAYSAAAAFSSASSSRPSDILPQNAHHFVFETDQDISLQGAEEEPWFQLRCSCQTPSPAPPAGNGSDRTALVVLGVSVGLLCALGLWCFCVKHKKRALRQVSGYQDMTDTSLARDKANPYGATA
mmetsp:Transcript_38321/g.75440  ORF Transcript_38321/g.75440 Transcript_38321/m.75440 type:complete len:998 (-) Transcript_38321:211-3204(-)|eukprot:CAMPEP_0175137734 /NCGR_PEP_ID=MMETSP0087-20121206/9970_1 /TAXON_ID=136419 /ORGANISM="Unknown Unknown, Strain D1" /LENGTH=997 /DNA_ID=CAMNT_0016420583 /DNA_START=33 /DNA_END=3026 /DNA_ORIENTATION=+